MEVTYAWILGWDARVPCAACSYTPYLSGSSMIEDYGFAFAVGAIVGLILWILDLRRMEKLRRSAILHLEDNE